MKFSQITINNSPVAGDYAVGVTSGGVDQRSTWTSIYALLASIAPTGTPLQTVETDYGNLVSLTTSIPYDDTPPQNTEGTQVMTQVITPKASTNNLLVEVDMYGSISAIGEFIGAVFMGSGVNAIAADSVTVAASGYLANVRMRCIVPAGTTSPVTFNVRMGAPGSQNVAFNGFTNSGTSGAATRAFNTTPKSSIKVTELKV